MGPTNIPLKSSKSMLPGLLSALPVVGGLLSSIVGSGQQRKADKRTFAHNKEMAEYAYSKDLEMWNRSNTYNDPSGQMARLKGAGLNPNLVYGTGTVSGNTSGQLPKYNAPTANFKKGPTPDFQGMLGQYHNIEQQKAQINLTNTQARVANEQARNTYLDSLNKTKSGKLKDQDFNQSESLFPHQLSMQEEKTEQQKNLTLSSKEKLKYDKLVGRLADKNIDINATWQKQLLRDAVSRGLGFTAIWDLLKSTYNNQRAKLKYPIKK